MIDEPEGALVVDDSAALPVERRPEVSPAQRAAEPFTATFDRPAVIVADRREQAGIAFVTAQCPRCGMVHSLMTAVPLQFACQCGTWIDLQ